MPAHRYVEENGSATMLTTKRSAGVTTEVNLKHHVTCMPLPSMSTLQSHFGFETQRGHHQKSKTGVSVVPQKGLMSLKNLNKNILVPRHSQTYSMWTSLYRSPTSSPKQTCSNLFTMKHGLSTSGWLAIY